MEEEKPQNKKNLESFFSKEVQKRTKRLLDKALVWHKKEVADIVDIISDNDDEDLSDFQQKTGMKNTKPKVKLKAESSNITSRKTKQKTEQGKAKPSNSILSSGENEGSKEPEQGQICEASSSNSCSESSDKKCCFCNQNVVHLKEHQQQCMKYRFQHQKDVKTENEKINCPICAKDLQWSSLQGRGEHINKCINKATDTKESDEEYLKMLQDARTTVIGCPMCGKKCQTTDTRIKHLKQCAQSRKMSVEQVRNLMEQQVEEYHNQLDVGILPQDFRRPTKAKVPKKPSKLTEDVQLAMALSTSMQEFESHFENIEKGTNEKCTTKPQGGRRKCKQKSTDSLLLSLTKEQANERISTKVGDFIFNGAPEETDYTKTPFFKKKRNTISQLESLWSKTSFTSMSSEVPLTSASSTTSSSSSSSSSSSALLPSSSEPFYVDALKSVVSVSKIVPGSKLKRCSEIPGRGRSFGPSADEATGLPDGIEPFEDRAPSSPLPLSPTAMSPPLTSPCLSQLQSQQHFASQTLAILAELAEENYSTFDSSPPEQRPLAPQRDDEEENKETHTDSMQHGSFGFFTPAKPTLYGRDSNKDNDDDDDDADTDVHNSTNALISAEESNNNNNDDIVDFVEDVSNNRNASSSSHSHSNLIATIPPAEQTLGQRDDNNDNDHNDEVDATSDILNSPTTSRHPPALAPQTIKNTCTADYGEEDVLLSPSPNQIDDNYYDDGDDKILGSPTRPVTESKSSYHQQESSTTTSSSSSTHHVTGSNPLERTQGTSWNEDNQGQAALDAFLTLVGSSIYSDVTIKAKGADTIAAHMNILSVRCPSMARMMSHEGNGAIIDLSQYSRASILFVLNYIYAGRIHPSPQSLVNTGEIHRLAKRLSLKALLNMPDCGPYAMDDTTRTERASLGNSIKKETAMDDTTRTERASLGNSIREETAMDDTRTERASLGNSIKKETAMDDTTRTERASLGNSIKKETAMDDTTRTESASLSKSGKEVCLVERVGEVSTNRGGNDDIDAVCNAESMCEDMINRPFCNELELENCALQLSNACCEPGKDTGSEMEIDATDHESESNRLEIENSHSENERNSEPVATVESVNPTPTICLGKNIKDNQDDFHGVSNFNVIGNDSTSHYKSGDNENIAHSNSIADIVNSKELETDKNNEKRSCGDVLIIGYETDDKVFPEEVGDNPQPSVPMLLPAMMMMMTKGDVDGNGGGSNDNNYDNSTNKSSVGPPPITSSVGPPPITSSVGLPPSRSSTSKNKNNKVAVKEFKMKCKFSTKGGSIENTDYSKIMIKMEKETGKEDGTGFYPSVLYDSISLDPAEISITEAYISPYKPKKRNTSSRVPRKTPAKKARMELMQNTPEKNTCSETKKRNTSSTVPGKTLAQKTRKKKKCSESVDNSLKTLLKGKVSSPDCVTVSALNTPGLSPVRLDAPSNPRKVTSCSTSTPATATVAAEKKQTVNVSRQQPHPLSNTNTLSHAADSCVKPNVSFHSDDDLFGSEDDEAPSPSYAPFGMTREKEKGEEILFSTPCTFQKDKNGRYDDLDNISKNPRVTHRDDSPLKLPVIAGKERPNSSRPQQYMPLPVSSVGQLTNQRRRDNSEGTIYHSLHSESTQSNDKQIPLWSYEPNISGSKSNTVPSVAQASASSPSSSSLLPSSLPLLSSLLAGPRKEVCRVSSDDKERFTSISVRKISSQQPLIATLTTAATVSTEKITNSSSSSTTTTTATHASAFLSLQQQLATGPTSTDLPIPKTSFSSSGNKQLPLWTYEPHIVSSSPSSAIRSNTNTLPTEVHSHIETAFASSTGSHVFSKSSTSSNLSSSSMASRSGVSSPQTRGVGKGDYSADPKPVPISITISEDEDEDFDLCHGTAYLPNVQTTKSWRQTTTAASSSSSSSTTPSKTTTTQPVTQSIVMPCLSSSLSPRPLRERLGRANLFGKFHAKSKVLNSPPPSIHQRDNNAGNGVQRMAGKQTEAEEKDIGSPQKMTSSTISLDDLEEAELSMDRNESTPKGSGQKGTIPSKALEVKRSKLPSPFTPMQPYNNMNTPELKSQLSRIGVKPLGKKRMRDLLIDVYKQTHQYETDSDHEATPKRRPEPTKMKSKDFSNSQNPRSAHNLSPAKMKSKDFSNSQNPRSAHNLSPAKMKSKDFSISQNPCSAHNLSPAKGRDGKDAGGSTSCSDFSSADEVNKTSKWMKMSEGEKGLAALVKKSAQARVTTSQSHNKQTEERGGDEGEDGELLSSQDSSCSDGPDLPEESILQCWPEEEETEAIPTQLTQTSLEVLRDRLMAFLRDNPDIYEKVLMYEALELDVLKKRIADAGIRIGIGRLQDFLDERCITFSMKNMSNRNNRQPAKNKRVKGKSPLKRKQVPKGDKPSKN